MVHERATDPTKAVTISIVHNFATLLLCRSVVMYVYSRRCMVALEKRPAFPFILLYVLVWSYSMKWYN
jgi:hypothetical protein